MKNSDRSINNKIIYDKYFESIYADSNILTELQYEKASEQFDFYYKKILPHDYSAKILDVGCGTGQFLYYLKKKGFKDIFGIDISEQQVEYCRKNITESVKKIDAFEFLNGKDQFYDLIAVHDVLEHIPKTKTLVFLNSIRNALKDNGVLIARVPNMSNPFSMDSRYRDFTHESGYTGKSLKQVLWTAGFRTIEIYSTEILIQSFRNRLRFVMVYLLRRLIRFLFYIQDYSVPTNLGKNLIVISRK
jgi:2-polyprenyl-3-methyl-5-hydroxy-6-metoxy-1,4-benzoquinol methylase